MSVVLSDLKGAGPEANLANLLASQGVALKERKPRCVCGRVREKVENSHMMENYYFPIFCRDKHTQKDVSVLVC